MDMDMVMDMDMMSKESASQSISFNWILMFTYMLEHSFIKIITQIKKMIGHNHFDDQI